MSRGLGERQRRMLDQLRANGADNWVPLHKLADDPDDPNEMAKARQSAHGLERRGLVDLERMVDEDRRVDTTVVMGEVAADWSVVYTAEPSDRAWSGMHVCLVDQEARQEHRREWKDFVRKLDEL